MHYCLWLIYNEKFTLIFKWIWITKRGNIFLSLQKMNSSCLKYQCMHYIILISKIWNSHQFIYCHYYYRSKIIIIDFLYKYSIFILPNFTYYSVIHVLYKFLKYLHIYWSNSNKINNIYSFIERQLSFPPCCYVFCHIIYLSHQRQNFHDKMPLWTHCLIKRVGVID